MKRLDMRSRTARHARSLLKGAGLLLTGATLAAVGSALAPDAARAGPVKFAQHNYVRAATPDAISNVLLDEEVTITFNSPVLGTSVGPDTILIRTGPTGGEQAHG